jgi:hypothetical protein
MTVGVLGEKMAFMNWEWDCICERGKRKLGTGIHMKNERVYWPSPDGLHAANGTFRGCLVADGNGLAAYHGTKNSECVS